MVTVYVREGQDVGSALRALKRKLQREKVIEGHKASLHFEKPSDVNRKDRFRRYIRAKKAQLFLDTGC